MSRFVNRTTQHVIDVTVLSVAFWVAFLLRFDWDPVWEMTKRHVIVWPYFVALQFALLVSFGIPKFAWRYVGLREATRILLAIAAGSALLGLTRLVAGWLMDPFPVIRYALVPAGVIVIDAALAYLGVAGVRVLRRIVAERHERDLRRPAQTEKTRTILIGAGEAGVLVAREMTRRPDLGLEPVAFVDDDRNKVGSEISGIPVLGTTADLQRLASELGAQQALITIASAPGRAIRDIAMRCKEIGLPTKIIPGVFEIVGGAVNLTRIRNVAIEDVLGREQVRLDEAGIARVVSGRVVLVTGAGGSIGSELCRQICRFGPTQLVLVERAENALFNIHRELTENHASMQLAPCVADVCDGPRMRQIFAQFQPSVVFHAAAHKHVPLMEWNPGEAIKNNVFGTKLVAELADEFGTSEFVLISTDKAVNPTSVMGASKRLAEITTQAIGQRSRTKFITVRFGNVLGSAGSVIPIFKEQIARGGPVTVTHPEMKRYFMTIPEACQLVLQAASMSAGNEIFILDMGEPMKILDLARDLIRLSGFTPDEDIEIKITGMRPGEKLFEDLTLTEEMADKTLHPKIFVGHVPPKDPAVVAGHLEQLKIAIGSKEPAEVRAKLAEAVPEYVGHGTQEASRPVLVAMKAS